MRPRPLADVATEAGGRLRGPGAEGVVITTVGIDSRAAGPGELFVALPGERSDGHDFVEAALEQGAAAALVRAGAETAARWAPRLIDAEDPARSLLAMAKAERRALSGRVVGVTGSTGKTCTKDFIGAVLGRTLRVAKSPASFNNEVGLPLTILSAPQDAEAIVCEMGARGRGHIRLLCDVARPWVGVVTNVGVAHLELFGSVEALREAKGELPGALPADGIAVLNADDPVVLSYADRTAATVMTYGRSRAADVRAGSVLLDQGTGRARFRLETSAGGAEVLLPVPGEHMVPNALAAVATGLAFGLPVDECAAGVAEAEISPGRMEVFETPSGVRVVNDAYNANPTSMAAALRAARWMAGTGRCIAALGHMAELGPIADEEHERIGELLARLGINDLVVVGEQASRIAVGAEREGVEPERIHRCESRDDALAVLGDLARPGDLVLVKASRVAGLERLADALRHPETAGVAATKGVGA